MSPRPDTVTDVALTTAGVGVVGVVGVVAQDTRSHPSLEKRIGALQS